MSRSAQTLIVAFIALASAAHPQELRGADEDHCADILKFGPIYSVYAKTDEGAVHKNFNKWFESAKEEEIRRTLGLAAKVSIVLEGLPIVGETKLNAENIKKIKQEMRGGEGFQFTESHVSHIFHKIPNNAAVAAWRDCMSKKLTQTKITLDAREPANINGKVRHTFRLTYNARPDESGRAPAPLQIGGVEAVGGTIVKANGIPEETELAAAEFIDYVVEPKDDIACVGLFIRLGNAVYYAKSCHGSVEEEYYDLSITIDSVDRPGFAGGGDSIWYVPADIIVYDTDDMPVGWVYYNKKGPGDFTGFKIPVGQPNRNACGERVSVPITLRRGKTIEYIELVWHGDGRNLHRIHRTQSPPFRDAPTNQWLNGTNNTGDQWDKKDWVQGVNMRVLTHLKNAPAPGAKKPYRFITIE